MPISHEQVTRRRLSVLADYAEAGLAACEVCELRCGVDRLHGEVGPCGLGRESYTYKRHLSLAEEVELLPAYMVYLSGCNMRCRFCVQAPQCFDPCRGERVDPQALSREVSEALTYGAKTITLIGGEPALHPHTILRIAAASDKRLPIALKTNLYLTQQTLDLLEPVVQVYVVDFKFGNDACAKRLAGIDRYTEVLERNLRNIRSDCRVIIRHLLMPGHLDCCFKPVAEWVGANLPDASFELMPGYVPVWRAEADTELGRACGADELADAAALVESLGLGTRKEAVRA